MYAGLLTVRFGDTKNLEQIAQWASAAGYAALEVHTRHLPPADVLADGGAAVKKILEATGLKISGIAHYSCFNKNTTPEEYQKVMCQTIDAAALLGVDVVCALAGFPAEGKSKTQTIREVVPGVFAPIVARAAEKKIKIAFENWFATNLQNLDHFRALVDALPQEHVGFNFDPSHLHWQQIDYLAAVEEFKARIFHTHAKDVAIRTHVRDRVGVLEGGWWRYCIPGFGEIPWGRYVLALRENGFDGVLSVEHEDRAFDAESGFAAALKHLSLYV
jgi:sugar phosphate isomerase/epimerase